MDEPPNPAGHRDGSSPDALLRRWQEAGETEALDELLRREVAAIRDLVLAKGERMLSGSAGASDIAQESVLRMLQLDEVPRFEDPGALRGYLWTTAWRLLLQRVRRPYQRKRVGQDAAERRLAEVAAPEAALGIGAAGPALDLAMNLLDEKEREALHRVYFERKGIPEVARELGISESALKMRLLRARRALAGRLAAWERIIG